VGGNVAAHEAVLATGGPGSSGRTRTYNPPVNSRVGAFRICVSRVDDEVTSRLPK
jgi:hypothetical protein